MSKDLSVVVEKEVSAYEREANKLEIVSDADMQKATVLLSQINTVGDKVTMEKKKIKDLYDNAVAVWLPIDKAVKNAVATIKGKMIARQNAIDAENAIIEARAMARVDRGTMKVETAVEKISALPDTKASVNTNAGSVQFRIVKKLKIVDVALVPREYMVVDEVRVRKELLEGKTIAGAVLVEEKSIANSR